ncbi:MAG: hydrolase [Draconibacterium sp.]|nr:MAG: hydrolase [Draconibacterium sp.]PIF06546.1 MAG: hydrolase [Draconibacterium sp.]
MKRKLFFRVSLLSLLLLVQCKIGQKSSEYYNLDDFYKLTKIDSHCHVFSKNTAFVEQAMKDNFEIISIMFDEKERFSIEQQLEMTLVQRQLFPKDLSFVTSFTMQDWEDEDWQEKTISHLKRTIEQGAVGMKIWKNIGMVEKDSMGNFIMIDNPIFDPIFTLLEENNIPVIGHIGEPRNCWLPLDSMTTNSDRRYYKSHPQYHMYLHPEYPSYEQIMDARNRMLKKHPNLKFIGAHLASVEWNLDELSKLLDEYPNLWLGTAARICHLQYHAQKDLKKVRDFMQKYQNRILYGTDLDDYGKTNVSPDELKEHIHSIWFNDWKFLTTDETLTAKEIDGEFSGLKLPKKVIDKIYYKNAKKLFQGIPD